MGVSGCGKSSVAQALAERIGGAFLDADPYHPAANIEKMSQGIPLTDEDRAGWLDILARLIRDHDPSRGPLVLACSALKESYRQRLRVVPNILFVFLKGSFELLSTRMQARQGHFMKAGMLESQLRTLEEPEDRPGAPVFTAEVSQSVDEIVSQVVQRYF